MSKHHYSNKMKPLGPKPLGQMPLKPIPCEKQLYGAEMQIKTSTAELQSLKKEMYAMQEKVCAMQEKMQFNTAQEINSQLNAYDALYTANEYQAVEQ